MTYLCHLAVMAAIYAMLALAANFAVGFGGLLALCAAAFSGVGAYAYALLSANAGWPFAAAFPAAVVVGSLASGAFAALALRFRGETFAVATMAVQTVAFGVFYNWTDVTGGAYGFPDIPRPSLFGFVFESPAAYAALSLAVLAAVVAGCVFFSPPRLALSLRALRDDEAAACTLGIAPRRTFLAAMLLFGALAGAAGALFAGYVSYVDPTGFAMGESVFVLAMLVVGGSGNVKGPLVGAATLVLLPEALRFMGLPDDVAGPMREIVYGTLLVVLMYLKPKGFAGDWPVR